MTWKHEIVYKVYQIVNGLLIEPRDGYNYSMFSTYGYESPEMAMKAIGDSNGNGLVILPVVFSSPE